MSKLGFRRGSPASWMNRIISTRANSRHAGSMSYRSFR